MKNKTILATIIIFSTLAVATIQSCKKNTTPRLSSINFYRTSNKFGADNFGENKYRTHGNLITFMSGSFLMEYNTDNFELKTIPLKNYYQLTFSSLSTVYGLSYSDNKIYINKLNISSDSVIKYGIKTKFEPKYFAVCTNPVNNDVFAFCSWDSTGTTLDDTFLLMHYSKDLKVLHQKYFKNTAKNYLKFNRDFYNPVTLKIIGNELFLFISENKSTLVKKLNLSLDTLGSYRNSVVASSPERHVTYLYSNNEFKILHFIWNSDVELRKIYLDAFNTSLQGTKSQKNYSAASFNALWTINNNNNIHCFSNMVESDGKFYFIDNSQLFEMDDNLIVTNTYPIPDLVELQRLQDNRICTVYARSIIKTQKGFTLILAADAYKSTGLYFVNIDKKGQVLN